MTRQEPGVGSIVSPVWEPPTRRAVAIAMIIGVVALGFFLLFGVLDFTIVAALLASLTIAIGVVLTLPILIIGSIAQIDFGAAGFHVAGVLGAILAIPVVANARIVLSYLWARVHSRDPWATST